MVHQRRVTIHVWYSCVSPFDCEPSLSMSLEVAFGATPTTATWRLQALPHRPSDLRVGLDNIIHADRSGKAACSIPFLPCISSNLHICWGSVKAAGSTFLLTDGLLSLYATHAQLPNRRFPQPQIHTSQQQLGRMLAGRVRRGHRSHTGS
jgi:hypothetical protein